MLLLQRDTALAQSLRAHSRGVLAACCRLAVDYRPVGANEVLLAAQALLWQQLRCRVVLRSPQAVGA